MKEIWKTIEFLNGRYAVSNRGRLKDMKKRRILKPCDNGSGYLRLCVYAGDHRRYFRVHRLVALAFIPNPEGLLYVDHINGDRGDNRVENLRWCSSSQNANFPLAKQHLRENARCKPRRIRGEKNGVTKTWEKLVDCVADIGCSVTLARRALSDEYPAIKRARGWTLTDITEE